MLRNRARAGYATPRRRRVTLYARAGCATPRRRRVNDRRREQ